MKHIFLFLAAVILFNCKPEKEEPLPITPNSNYLGSSSASRSIKNIQVLNPKLKYGTVKDIDKNSYATITIGTQTWMAENLKVSRYSNGDAIVNVTDNNTWPLLTTGAYAYYNNDPGYNNLYGKLYNWYAAKDVRGICPSGWHLPSDVELTTLISYLDPSFNASLIGPQNSLAAAKLKSSGTQLWPSPNTATNESGFSGLPGGYRDGGTGNFYLLGLNGCWWSSASDSQFVSWASSLYEDDKVTGKGGFGNYCGLSVRCLKD